MNNMGKSSLGLFLLIVIIFTLIYTVSAQENNTNETISKESGIVTLSKATISEIPQKGDVSKEEIIIEAQKSLDRSLSILNIVATSIGVLVGLITIIFVIAIAIGFFEYRRWKVIRKDIEKEANIIKEIRNRAENDANTIRNEVKLISPNILTEKTEKPSSELIEKFDELNHRLDLLEILGLSLNPEDYSNRAFNLYLKKDFESALKTIEKAIESEPNQSNFWWIRGISLNKLGRHDDALKAFNKEIELGPDIDHAWYNRACTYSIKGNKENAVADLKKAIELDKSNKERAKKDKDFETLWDDTDFKRLVD